MVGGHVRRWSAWVLAGGLVVAAHAGAEAHPGYDARLESLSERIAASPSDRGLRLQRAEAYRRAGHFHDALRDLAVIAREDPDDTAMRIERALVHIARGRARAAERDLDAAIDRGPASATAHWERAKLHEVAGRLAAAREDLDAAIALGGTPDLYLDRARVDAAQGDLVAAAAGLAQGCSELSDPVVLRLALVDAERRRGAPAEALAVVDAMLVTAPRRADWVLLRGDVLGELGRDGEALGERLRALALSHAAIANRPTAAHRMSRARIYLALSLPRSALPDLEAVVATAHDLPEARALLRRAKEALG